ncbi:hypothetical protein [Streptomyces sp. NPDC018352]|uniref:hypothetical protein n=1 Tax=Streptomyces sp. NPDC018352 TaxID=3157194 RepID=UPI0033E1898B
MLEPTADGRRPTADGRRRTADGGLQTAAVVRRRPDVGERVGSEAEHTQDGLRAIVDIVDPLTDFR